MGMSDFVENQPEPSNFTEAAPSGKDASDSPPAGGEGGGESVSGAENSSPSPAEPNNSDSATTATPAAAPTTAATPTSATTANPVTSPNEILNSILSKIGDIDQQANFKMMIYGEPGSTKSSFSATAPNNLIADLEDGLISAKSSPHGIAPGVQKYPWSGFEDFTKLVVSFAQNPPELDRFKVLTIDTFSDLHKRALAEVTEREWRKRPSSNRYVPEVEHHSENNERMIRMIRALRDLNRDLIVVSHAKTVEPKNKPAKTYPDFSESLANKIMAMMDIVGYMTVKTIEGKPTPVLRVVTDGTIQCKTRVPLPAEIINPTYSQLRAAWEKTLMS